MKKFFGYIFDLYWFLLILILGLLIVGLLGTTFWDAIQIFSPFFSNLIKVLKYIIPSYQNVFFFLILLPMFFYWYFFRRIPPFLKINLFKNSLALVFVAGFLFISYDRLQPVSYIFWQCEPEFELIDGSIEKGSSSLYDKNIPFYKNLDVFVKQKRVIFYQAPLARSNDLCYFPPYYDFNISGRLIHDRFGPSNLCPVNFAEFSPDFMNYVNDMEEIHANANEDYFFSVQYHPNLSEELKNTIDKYDFNFKYLFNNYENENFDNYVFMKAKCKVEQSFLVKRFDDHQFIKDKYLRLLEYDRFRRME